MLADYDVLVVIRFQICIFDILNTVLSFLLSYSYLL